MKITRKFFKVVSGMDMDGYEVIYRRELVEVKPEDSELVSSLTNRGLHAPILDIDFPVQLIPSATEGHFHLYLETEITWRNYRRLLKALVKAGIIERSYYKASIGGGMTLLRSNPASKNLARA
jgi:hypothetical protein